MHKRVYSPKAYCAKGTRAYFRKAGHVYGVNKKQHDFSKFRTIR